MICSTPASAAALPKRLRRLGVQPLEVLRVQRVHQVVGRPAAPERRGAAWPHLHVPVRPRRRRPCSVRGGGSWPGPRARRSISAGQSRLSDEARRAGDQDRAAPVTADPRSWPLRWRSRRLRALMPELAADPTAVRTAVVGVLLAEERHRPLARVDPGPRSQQGAVDTELRSRGSRPGCPPAPARTRPCSSCRTSACSGSSPPSRMSQSGPLADGRDVVAQARRPRCGSPARGYGPERHDQPRVASAARVVRRRHRRRRRAPPHRGRDREQRRRRRELGRRQRAPCGADGASADQRPQPRPALDRGCAASRSPGAAATTSVVDAQRDQRAGGGDHADATGRGRPARRQVRGSRRHPTARRTRTGR